MESRSVVIDAVFNTSNSNKHSSCYQVDHRKYLGLQTHRLIPQSIVLPLWVFSVLLYIYIRRTTNLPKFNPLPHRAFHNCYVPQTIVKRLNILVVS